MTETREYMDYDQDAQVKELIVHGINCWDFFAPLNPSALKVTVIEKNGRKHIIFEILKGQEILHYVVWGDDCEKLAEWLHQYFSE